MVTLVRSISHVHIALSTWLTPRLSSRPDLPELARVLYANNVSAFNLNEQMPKHVDIPRLRTGKVGGFFWYVEIAHFLQECVVLTSGRSVYVRCPKDAGPDFVNPSWRVR